MEANLAARVNVSDDAWIGDLQRSEHGFDLNRVTVTFGSHESFSWYRAALKTLIGKIGFWSDRKERSYVHGPGCSYTSSGDCCP